MKTAILLLACAISASAQTNAWKKVIVERVGDRTGQNTKCVINGQWVFLQGLNPELEKLHKDYDKLHAEIIKLTDEAVAEEKRIRKERAYGPQEAQSGTPAGNRIRALNIAAHSLEQKQEQIEDKIEQRAKVLESIKALWEIEAVETTQSYGGMKLWGGKAQIMDNDYSVLIGGVITILALILLVMWVMIPFILLGIRKDIQQNHEELMAIQRQLSQINIREERREETARQGDRPPII